MKIMPRIEQVADTHEAVSPRAQSKHWDSTLLWLETHVSFDPVAIDPVLVFDIDPVLVFD